MKRALTLILFSILVAGLIFAQAKPNEPAAAQPKTGSMNCPMMAKMASQHGQHMAGKMDHKMSCMKGGSCPMSAMSSDAISSLLSGKKTELGLTDSQVKQVSDLIATAQKKKAEEKMQAMMGSHSTGSMPCCCMQKAAQ